MFLQSFLQIYNDIFILTIKLYDLLYGQSVCMFEIIEIGKH